MKYEVRRAKCDGARDLRSSILMISARREQRPITLGETRAVPLVYDFCDFPEKYCQTTYPGPGAPALATGFASVATASWPACAGDPTGEMP